MKKPLTQKQKTLRHLNNPQFGFVRALVKEFVTAEVYLVGGAVRDMLLSRPTKDYDFVVRNVPITILQRFLKKYGSVRLVGKKFGVLKFMPTGSSVTPSQEPLDIALPRTEHSDAGTGHYRDFQIKTDYRLPIEDDLSRRDFTINALALNLHTGAIVDPFGGMSDLKKGMIRSVGKPEARFVEDYSRMLRAIRFACQLRFAIERETSKAIHANIQHLNKEMKPRARLTKRVDRNTMRVVPYEVVARELGKALIADPVHALDLFDTYGVIESMIPELLSMKGCPQEKRWHSEGDVWTHTRLALSVLVSKKFEKEFGATNTSALLAFAVLFHDIGKPATLQTPETHGTDRIRTHGHDRVGAEMCRIIARRLRLYTAPEFDGTADDLYWLVQRHLLILGDAAERLNNTTIEKYFFRDRRRGDLLMRLVFCDSSASLRESGRANLESFRAFQTRLKVFEQQHHVTLRKRSLPPPLLNGDDIMRLCRLKPGPRVGELREALREEQLSGRVTSKRGAAQWLKKQRV